MINGIQLKVCGITRRIDAESANLIGADYLGFNLYPKSPRYTPLEKFEELSARLPQRRKVAIMVRPTVEELAAAKEAGFDFFQVHFDPESDRRRVESWVPVVGKDRLWLATRLPPDQSFPEWLLPLADTFLIDTFREDSYGGSGETGDWGRFRDLQATRPEKTWILAGGLAPSNIAEALAQTEAKVVDVNSGVEIAPGLKDPEKLEALATAMKG